MKKWHAAMMPLDDKSFEGTLVLEQLATYNKLEDFFDAVDADDVQRAAALMKQVGVDAAEASMVIKKMSEGDSEP